MLGFSLLDEEKEFESQVRRLGARAEARFEHVTKAHLKDNPSLSAKLNSRANGSAF